MKQKNKNIILSIQTLTTLKQFSKLAKSIYIDKDRVVFNDNYMEDKKKFDEDYYWYSYLFEDDNQGNHFFGEAVLDQQLSQKPIKLETQGLVKLLEEFNSPVFTFNKKKIVITDQVGKTKKIKTYKEIPELPVNQSIDNSSLEYVVELEKKDIQFIQKYIHVTRQQKGFFINGNPTRTKIIFTKERKKKLLVVEDRNHGITQFTQPIKVIGGPKKKKFKYIHHYMMMKKLPFEDYEVQLSGGMYLSEWFCIDKSWKFTIDLVKTTYAKN
jgi:hypothetical protein